MNLLHTIGLMTRAEHEATAEANERQADRIRSLESDVRRMTIGRDDWRSAAKHWEAKFKQVVADLEKQAGEIAVLRRLAENAESRSRGFEKLNLALISENNALRPDALAMRRKRQRDRDLKAAKAAGKVQP